MKLELRILTCLLDNLNMSDFLCRHLYFQISNNFKIVNYPQENTHPQLAGLEQKSHEL
jgi:hypothetical protein